MNQPLASLLEGLEVSECPLDRTTAISGLSYDSRTTHGGNLFFALPGSRTDGTHFASLAMQKGAAAVVAEAPIEGASFPVIVVRDARLAMAQMAANFFERPAESLRIVAITGTNGKTTTAFLCRHILDAVHKRCGLIGTIKYIVGDQEFDAPRTTPESADLQALLARMRDAGAKAVAMEASSHALHQKRTASIEFDAAVFTNLTQDHLDYHQTMDAYYEAKAILFNGLSQQTKKKGRAIINADDRYGHRLIERISRKVPTITYGFRASANFRATDIRSDAQGSTFHLEARNRTYLVRLPLIGSFNVQNALAALAATASMGVEVRAAVQALAAAPQVPGRLERVPARRSFQVFVDYAHTDDALRNVLRTLRDLQPSRLIVVVGCGGDRDRAKRPLMAAAAEEGADWTILTSDNPRSEDPLAILADMRAGLRSKRFEEIPDREAAIRHAVDIAEPGNIVLIAGKGHETYQEFATGRIPFDDVKVARWAIESKRLEFEPEEEEESKPWTP